MIQFYGKGLPKRKTTKSKGEKEIKNIAFKS